MSNMQKLLDERKSHFKILERGQLTEGVVVKSNGKDVLIDIGGKSEGIIARRELEEGKIDLSSFKVGDKIKVIVNQSETDQGFTTLSIKKALVEDEWEKAKKTLEGGAVIEARISDINSGGVVVSLGSISGFVPISHLAPDIFTRVRKAASNELKPSDRGLIKQELLKEKLKVKIIEIDRKKNRLVASQKYALSARNPERTAGALREIKVGSIFGGKITNVTPFGIFVDIGQVEGLAHVSELSWEHVAHPAQIFSPGEKVKVKVIEVRPEEGKVSLSVKALVENPWHKFASVSKVGAITQGKVVKIVPYGIFVNLAPGLDGFMHASEIAKPLKIGEVIEAIVTEMDLGKKKISLSTKKLTTS